MSIVELTSTEVVQRCAKCDAVHRVPLRALQAGVAREMQGNPNIVALPECSTCHSSEFLLRSPTNAPVHPIAGSFSHLHQLLVDELHAELVNRKQLAFSSPEEAGRAALAPPRTLSSEERARWFPHGLKVESSKAEAVAPGKPLS